MKFEIDSTSLVEAARLLRAVGPGRIGGGGHIYRSGLGIRVDGDGKLRFSVSEDSHVLRVTRNAENVDEAGDFVVDMNFLQSAVKIVPPEKGFGIEKIILEKTERGLCQSCSRTYSNGYLVKSGKLFALLNSTVNEYSNRSDFMVSIPWNVLQGALKFVRFGIPSDDLWDDRLKGALLEITENGLNCVAGDGFRIYEFNHKEVWKEKVPSGGVRAFLPRKSVIFLLNILSRCGGMISVGMDRYRFYVEYPGLEASLVLSQNRFPTTYREIFKNLGKCAVLELKPFRDGVADMLVMADPNNNYKMIGQLGEDRFHIFHETRPEVFSRGIPVKYDEDFRFAFNIRLLDIILKNLSQFGSSDVEMWYGTAKEPILFRIVRDKDVAVIAMTTAFHQ